MDITIKIFLAGEAPGRKAGVGGFFHGQLGPGFSTWGSQPSQAVLWGIVCAKEPQVERTVEDSSCRNSSGPGTCPAQLVCLQPPTLSASCGFLPAQGSPGLSAPCPAPPYSTPPGLFGATTPMLCMLAPGTSDPRPGLGSIRPRATRLCLYAAPNHNSQPGGPGGSRAFSGAPQLQPSPCPGTE